MTGEPGVDGNTALEKYAETLDDLSEPERLRRLDILRAFATFVERTPDRMVDELFDRVTMKYRKRGYYTERIKAFTEQVEGPRSTKVFSGNVIRAFFIANGLRIPPEKPSWM